MDQAVDDSNQPATGQYPNVTASEFRRSVECFAKAFHASPFVQTVTKFDTGRYLYVNDRFVSDAGYTREEVIGKTSIELGILADKPDRLWLTQGLRQRGRLTRKKLRFRLRSGDVCIGSFVAQVLKLDGEDVILSTVTDITEQLDAERRYRHASRRAALVEQVAADLAHEVKNPLAGIKGVADAFLKRHTLTEQEREWMEAVRHSVQKIDAQTRELLHLAQPNVRATNQCSLNQLARRVVVLAQHQANAITERKILVEFVDASGEPLNVAGDAARLEEAILNVVLNAIESIEENGRVTVRLSCRSTASHHNEAAITVTDTGCGIPVADRQRIFEPFFTTKPEGTGLGLSTVQRTAATFHGRVTFESSVGRGSSFELTFPLPATLPESHER